MRWKKMWFLLLSVSVMLCLYGCGSTETESTAAERSVKTEGIRTFSRTDFAMGTVISETVYSSGEDPTQSYVKQLTELEENLISWRTEGSEIDQINAAAGTGESVKVSDSTRRYLEDALSLARESGGKLDPTIGKLTRLWNIDGEDTSSDHSIPSEAQIQELLQNVDYERISLDGNEVTLPEGTSLDLGAVGKGIGCDEIADLLRKDEEVQGAVIAVGGSILTWGQKADQSPWQVAVADPRGEEGTYMGVVSVTDQEKYISTSGDYEKYFEKDGKRYHHILDPDTGYPADSGLISVTVVCDQGLMSDGLSTACFILGKEKGMKLLETCHAEGVFIDSGKNVYVTDGLRDSFQILSEEYVLAE